MKQSNSLKIGKGLFFIFLILFFNERSVIAAHWVLNKISTKKSNSAIEDERVFSDKLPVLHLVNSSISRTVWEQSLFLVTGEKLLMSGQRIKGSTKCSQKEGQVREMCHIKVIQCNAKVTSWLNDLGELTELTLPYRLFLCPQFLDPMCQFSFPKL